MSKIKVQNIKLPKIKLPKIKLPKIKWPPTKRPKRSPKEAPEKEEKVHPWRECPKGKHYREGTFVSAHVRKGKPVRAHTRTWSCPPNPSGKDQMYPEEMEKIAQKHFHTFKDRPLGTLADFKEKGDQYDHLIQGWVTYWNDILKPSDPLDPHVVKALIASESSFNSKAWNKRKGLERADGLMQITHRTLQYLKDNFKELRDHYINLNPKDMLDPNLSICAGVRWLFRKKEIADSKTIGGASWIDAVGKYKRYEMDSPRMKEFIDIYKELKKQ